MAKTGNLKGKIVFDPNDVESKARTGNLKKGTIFDPNDVKLEMKQATEPAKTGNLKKGTIIDPNDAEPVKKITAGARTDVVEKSAANNSFVAQFVPQKLGKWFCGKTDDIAKEGETKDFMTEGRGIMKYNNGDTYDGEWKDFMMNGNGTMKYKHGDVYKGEWRNGKRHGKAIFTFANGFEHSGEWQHDKEESEWKKEKRYTKKI